MRRGFRIAFIALPPLRNEDDRASVMPNDETETSWGAARLAHDWPLPALAHRNGGPGSDEEFSVLRKLADSMRGNGKRAPVQGISGANCRRHNGERSTRARK